MIHHVTRATRHLIFWTLLITAISLTVIRIMLAGVDSYKLNLETRIGAALGAPVKLGGLGANMRGITPELVLKNITVTSALQTESNGIRIKEIRWGIHLGQYLLNRELLPSSAVTLIGAEFSAYRTSDGHFAIDGLKSHTGQPLWLLQGQYNLLNSRITWQDRQKSAKPVLFDEVNLSLLNEGENHQIKSIITLPAAYGGAIKLIGDVKGGFDQLADLTGNLYMEGNSVKLPELTSSYLPLNIRAITGSSDFKIWSKLQPETKITLIGVAQLKDAILAREGNGQLPVKRLDTFFKANLTPNAWRIDFDQFELSTDSTANRKDNVWSNAIFGFGYNEESNTSPATLKFHAKEIDLAEAYQVVRFFAPLPVEQIQKANSFEIGGILKDFRLYAEPKNKNFALAGQFESLYAGAHSSINIPSFDHISGRIKGTNNIGMVDVNGKNIHFDYSRFLAKPVVFDDLKGLINWQYTDDGWKISTDDIELNSPAFRSISRLAISQLKDSQSPFIDLQTTLKSDDVSKIGVYFPTQVMNNKLKLWLTSAFKGGEINNGELLLYGKADDFPFTNGAGVFEAALPVEKLQLKFHPDWQQINDIKGKITFDKDSIAGKFDGGRIEQANINPTEMLISGLASETQLKIKGGGEGEINEILKVLQQSPLSSRVNPIINNTKIFGKTKATLDLAIPFSSDKPIGVEANALLTDGQLTVNRLNLPLTRINGAIKFNSEGAFTQGLQAFALGFPVKADVNTVDQKTQITLNGKTEVREIAKLLKSPLLLGANGESEYLVEVSIPSLQDNITPIQTSLKTDLKGIEFNLPGGFNKTKLQTKPLDINVALTDKLQELPIVINYNNEVKAALKMALPQQSIVSGHILLGKGMVNFPSTPGIKLELNKNPLALQDYLPLLGNSGEPSQSTLVREIKIHSDSALWGKARLGNLDLSLKRNTSFWSGEIDSVFAKGIFDIPLDFSKPNPAVLAMDMINLSALKQLKDGFKTSSTNLNILPHIRSKKTLWRSADLGQLTLETAKSPLGVKIKRLSLEGEDETLEATGDWENTNFSSVTHLQGQWLLRRADQFFSKMNITKDFTETSGSINFQINWHASPWQLALPDLRGHMDVKLNKGRILSIEPGFGRILGILALEQWVKRLQLDFSDIFEEGLSYNSIKGDFNLARGKASTQNLFVDAVPAKISISGETDYVHQTLDHLVKVVPKSSDAVPIAGTIMGKIAEFIGQSITGKNQEGFFFGKQYTVKGNWDNAEIKPLHQNDGILQKTWTNITGAQ